MKGALMFDNELALLDRNITPQGGVSEKSKKEAAEGNHCVIVCKKISPNLFHIRNGVAVMKGMQGFSENNTQSISCATKTFFIFE